MGTSKSPRDPGANPRHETVGLVGVGLVGTALADHLLAAGHRVVGCDIDPARCGALADLGGEAVGSPAEVARRARRVFLSLMTTEVVCQVVEGREGLLSAAPPPTFVIDTTTGEPEAVIALAGRLRTRGVGFLDATISGSSQQIRDRQAVFMVGGDAAVFAACADLLAAVGDKVFHVGPSGGGAKAKLASNLILGLNRLVLAEGLAFAEGLGLELAPFLELLKASPAYSVAMDAKGEKMLKGDFSPQARVTQHRKDLAIILATAARFGQQLPLARVHAEVLDSLIAAGEGDLDCSAVITEIRRRRGGI